MDWLRRNWPDLLIGIALIAVIAGIVATLLTGGSFFPIGPGQGTTPVSTPNVTPTTPPPAAPGVAQDDVPGTATETPAELPDTAVPTPDAASPNQPDPQPQAGSDGGVIAVLPPAGQSVTPAASGDASTSTGEPATPDAPAAPPTETAAPPSAVDAPASANAPTAPYRVSVGAFGSEENAQGQAAVFRDAGFPVFLGRQGDLVLVLVGPYDTQQEAEQAVSQIRSGEFGIDPVIYRFQPDGETASASPAAQDTPVQGSSPTPAADEPAASAPEPTSDGSFLQVGAYATRESALPQIQRLQDVGFDVTELQESGLVKVLVGPFEGDALSSARQQLQTEGIEHFVR